MEVLFGLIGVLVQGLFLAPGRRIKRLLGMAPNDRGATVLGAAATLGVIALIVLIVGMFT